MRHYHKWANELFPGLSLEDFATIAETELQSEEARKELVNYRVEHLRREGVFRTKEEDDRLTRAEENRQRAIEKRKLLINRDS